MSSSMISINYVYVLPFLKTKPLPFIKFHACNHIMDKSKFHFLKTNIKSVSISLTNDNDSITQNEKF